MCIRDSATTIDAPPDHIWPWLVQMGWGRGQWYTARWVDLLLFPDNGPSADRLHPEWESGTIWGSYAAAAWRSGVLVNAGCHPVEVVGELVVEDPDTDLQQEVRAARGPAHLLLLDHALADQLVDRGLDERGRDGLAGPVALAVVGDPLGVGADVAVELAHRLEQLGLRDAGLGDVEVDRQLVDDL